MHIDFRKDCANSVDSLLPAAIVLVLLVIAAPCAGGADPAHGGFTDVTTEAGLHHVQRRGSDIDYDALDEIASSPDAPEELTDQVLLNESHFVSGGGAVGDFFGNGLLDLFLTRHDDTDILYKNLGDGTFEDRTADVFGDQMQPGPTNGAMFADLNNNGHLDLYVTTNEGRRHRLYINDGFGRLIEDAEARGAALAEPPDVDRNAGMSVTAADYDNDGYLDLFINDWRPRPDDDHPPRNRLLRNRGADAPAHFEDVTHAAGLDFPDNHFGFSGRFADMNRNGRLDLLTVSDFSLSQFFQNNGDGTFTRLTDTMGIGTGTNEMGSTVADYNNNGYLDWFVSSISINSGNRLYRNEIHRGWPGIHFTDQTDAGVRNSFWGWGASFIDYNNNGLRDLVNTNGWLTRTFLNRPTFLWKNNGPQHSYRFTDVTEQVGLSDREQGRGLIVADFFNNGHLDILVINYAGPPVLYRNNGGPNSWLRINTVGDKSNAMGIGAFITVQPDAHSDHQLVHDVNLGTNFLAHNETTAHFGLGDHHRPVHRITIEWPSGARQDFHDVQPNQLITIHESQGIIRRDPLVAESDVSQ